jgi:hypothetical protein
MKLKISFDSPGQDYRGIFGFAAPQKIKQFTL